MFFIKKNIYINYIHYLFILKIIHILIINYIRFFIYLKKYININYIRYLLTKILIQGEDEEDKKRKDENESLEDTN